MARPATLLNGNPSAAAASGAGTHTAPPPSEAMTVGVGRVVAASPSSPP